MNTSPTEHWRQLVAKTMSQRSCGLSEAWRITSGANPDAAILMSAFGRSRQTVQFFNSRQAAKATPEKDRAKKEFYQFVNEKTQHGLSYVAAYNSAAREHPDLIAAMAGGAGVQFANTKDGKAPAATAMLKKLLYLPESATEEHFQAAFQGNGSTLSPQHPAKIFAALTDLTQKKSGGDYDTAIAQTKAAFPELWSAVEKLSAEPV